MRNGAHARPRARLLGVSGYAPEKVMTNADFEAMFDTSDEWIVSRTGISERRMAAPDEAASDMGVGAARVLLDRLGMSVDQVDMVIALTSTQDYIFPSTASVICDRLGSNAASMDVMAGCTGYIYGLAQACALVEAGLAQNVLIVACEVLTRFADYTDRSTCILFGDGGGATLVGAADPDDTTGFLGFELGTDGSGIAQLLVPGGGSRRHPGLADYRREESFISMNGREVFKFATRAMVDSATKLLDKLEIGIGEVDLLVAHQANLRIIEHATKRLGIDPDKVHNNVDRFGNTSSASIPIALAEAIELGKVQPGGLLLLVGFGAGLTWGSTVVRYEPAAVAA